jgi:hypothetical protein
MEILLLFDGGRPVADWRPKERPMVAEFNVVVASELLILSSALTDNNESWV